MSGFTSFEKQFFLLGSRRYVHGSSQTYGLLEAMVKWKIESIERIKLDIHEPLLEHGRYDLYTETSKPLHGKTKYNAIFRLFGIEETYWVGLKGTGVPVSTRRPYSEEQLIDGYKLIKSYKSIALNLRPHLPSINTIIALNKKLAGSLFPSQGYEQWYLSRYDVSWALLSLTEPVQLEIKCVGNVGLSHIHSTVTLNSEKSGSIYFSRRKK